MCGSTTGRSIMATPRIGRPRIGLVLVLELVVVVESHPRSSARARAVRLENQPAEAGLARTAIDFNRWRGAHLVLVLELVVVVERHPRSSASASARSSARAVRVENQP